MKRFLLLLLFFMPCVALAGPKDFDTRAFGQIPVQADGRIKPLDSFARVMLTRIHGEGAYENLSASQWLAFVLFNPTQAMKAPMFYIRSPFAAQGLGLEVSGDHYYSFEDIAAVLPTRATAIQALMSQDKSSYTQVQAEVVRVYGAMGEFAELIGTFSLLQPLENVNDTIRARVHVPAGQPVTIFDLHKEEQGFTVVLNEIVRTKGRDEQNYTPAEREFTRMATRLLLQEQLDKDNELVRVIPPAWGGDEWLSPWGVLKASSGSPESADLFARWRAMVNAYNAGDTKSWGTATDALLKQTLATLPPFVAWQLMLEYYYHALGLLAIAAVCYGLGLGLMLARLSRTGYWALLLGLALHGTAILMRMLILMRPPVSTLYESLLFVSFLVMAASVWFAGRGKSAAGLAGAFTGFLLLLATWVFAGDSDTLGVLVAVLNTNFWLGTHVVCITTGYGCSLLAGAIAHIYLFRRCVQRVSEDALAPTARLLHATAIIALCFTAIGTMLGGIWADQSWGRFWGWDPKENGALLIVLWLTWLLHGRVARQLTALSFAAWMALVNVVVAVAWIGVNLLSVGLHSYGFTDTAANGLIGFCSVEFAYVAGMMAMRRFIPSPLRGEG